MEMFNLKGVEVFSVGKWNGDEFTLDDLNHMILSFEDTKAGIARPLKLGHGKEQKLLQKEGLPAAGWVEKLYINGNKLVADFRDIPKKIYKLLEVGAYKKVSIEMFTKVNIKGKEYKNLITAVALLGAETPGVMDLNDIMAMYETEETPKSYEQTLEFNFKDNRKDSVMEKTEQEIKLALELEQTQKNFEAEQTKAKEAQEALEAKDKEIADLKQFKADADKKALEAEIAAKEASLKAFVTGLKADKLCTPGMEPLVTELLGEEKKEYTVQINKEEKKLTKEQLLKEALLLFQAAKEVNFVESSSQGDEKSKLEAAEKALDEKAKKFAAENKITYGQAMKKIKELEKGQ